MSEKLLNTDQAAELLGVARNTVTTWITSGLLKAEKSKEDGRWYTTISDLKEAQAKQAERKRKGSRGRLPRGNEGLESDPILLLVKAIVYDEMKSYQNSLSKGRDTYAHEAYLRSSDFARMTGGLVDPEELIRRMRARYAQ